MENSAYFMTSGFVIYLLRDLCAHCPEHMHEPNPATEPEKRKRGLSAPKQSPCCYISLTQCNQTIITFYLKWPISLFTFLANGFLPHLCLEKVGEGC